MDLTWFGVRVVVVLCLTTSVERTASQTNAKSGLQNGMYVNSLLLIVTSNVSPAVEDALTDTCIVYNFVKCKHIMHKHPVSCDVQLA